MRHKLNGQIQPSKCDRRHATRGQLSRNRWASLEGAQKCLEVKGAGTGSGGEAFWCPIPPHPHDRSTARILALVASAISAGTVAGFQVEHVGAQRLETQRIRRHRACRTTFMDITGRTDPASMSYT